LREVLEGPYRGMYHTGKCKRMTEQTILEKLQAEQYWTAKLTEAEEVRLPREDMGHIYLFDRLHEKPLSVLCRFLEDQGLPPAPVGCPRQEIEFAVAGILQERWFREARKTVPESVIQSSARHQALYKKLVAAINSGEYDMAKKEKVTKTAKRAAEPKELLITRYTLTKKSNAKSEQMLTKECMTHNAVIYRHIADQKESPTFEEIRDGVGTKAFGSESKNVDSIFRWHIQDLRKKGFIRSSEDREEVETAA
jgi:hypothetical protein